MRVEYFPPDSDTEPRHWVRHDQAFAMMLGPGSIEWGSKRYALEKFDYAAGDLALCHRHEGEWVGLMNVLRIPLKAISDSGGKPIIIPEGNRSGVGAKRRWFFDVAKTDRNRQAESVRSEAKARCR